MGAEDQALEAFSSWYDGLRVYKSSAGPARGTIAAALVVLERLKSGFNLSLDYHRAAGQSQIKGVSGTAVRDILARFGETRRFLSEGGRTNRGAAGDVGGMLDAIGRVGLDGLPPGTRSSVLEELQRFLVEKVREYHGRQRLELKYDPAKTTWESIHNVLALAREAGKEGQVAQYLVGAKLQLRFPKTNVGNETYSTADEQLDRPGDFSVGSTAFHVTVAPMPGVYEKCQQNLEDGLRAYLLVRDGSLAGARQNADLAAPGRITVGSIESFVAQNVEEMSEFSTDRLRHGFRRLLETYNQRVDAIETDKSLLIEIPATLHR